MMIITNNIKVLRAKRDMSQEELAKEAGVTRQTINAIENSKYVPTLTLAFALAEIFGVDVEEVFRRK